MVILVILMTIMTIITSESIPNSQVLIIILAQSQNKIKHNFLIFGDFDMRYQKDERFR